jgi:hypothetical protein
MKDSRNHLERSYRSLFVIRLNKQFEKFIDACQSLNIDSGAAAAKYSHYVTSEITYHIKEIVELEKESERVQTNFFLMHVQKCFAVARLTKSYSELESFYMQARQAYLDNESSYYYSKDFKKLS